MPSGYPSDFPRIFKHLQESIQDHRRANYGSDHETDRRTAVRESEARKANLNAGIRCVRSRIPARERKRDTRRKILVGAMVLKQVDQNPEGQKLMLQDLDEFLEHPSDCDLFDLPTKYFPPIACTSPGSSYG